MTERNAMWDALRRHKLAIASLVCIGAISTGCSSYIAEQYRIGPKPDSDVNVRTSTPQDVERILGTPTETERLADGRVRAVYEYSVREGIWPRERYRRDAMWQIAPFTLGASELLFIPMVYFAKDSRTYRKEYIYDPSWTVVEYGPELLKD